MPLPQWVVIFGSFKFHSPPYMLHTLGTISESRYDIYMYTMIVLSFLEFLGSHFPMISRLKYSHPCQPHCYPSARPAHLSHRYPFSTHVTSTPTLNALDLQETVKFHSKDVRLMRKRLIEMQSQTGFNASKIMFQCPVPSQFTVKTVKFKIAVQ